MNPSVVHPSSMGSVAGPTLRIWKKWSMTQIESKPTSSAQRTILASVGPIVSVPPGYVNDGIWRPSFTGISCALERFPRWREAASLTEEVVF